MSILLIGPTTGRVRDGDKKATEAGTMTNWTTSCPLRIQRTFFADAQA